MVKWNAGASAWEQVGSPLSGPVFAISSLKGHLVAGGLFTAAGGNTNANHIAEWDGANWKNLGKGIAGTNDSISPSDPGIESAVLSLATCGTNLFAGGDFAIAGELTNANSIAMWDGLRWKAVGQGLSMEEFSAAGYTRQTSAYKNPLVYCVLPHGNSLYVAGQFTGIWNS